MEVKETFIIEQTFHNLPLAMPIFKICSKNYLPILPNSLQILRNPNVLLSEFIKLLLFLFKLFLSLFLSFVAGAGETGRRTSLET